MSKVDIALQVEPAIRNDHQRCLEEIVQLRARVKQYQAALAYFGCHDRRCPKSLEGELAECFCGLCELLGTVIEPITPAADS